MAGKTLSRPAFYQTFTDLHDLIVTLWGDIKTIMHQTADRWISGEGEAIAALRKTQRRVVETCVAHGPISVRSRRLLLSTSSSIRPSPREVNVSDLLGARKLTEMEI